jgi:hypothetical protein
MTTAASRNQKQHGRKNNDKPRISSVQASHAKLPDEKARE